VFGELAPFGADLLENDLLVFGGWALFRGGVRVRREVEGEVVIEVSPKYLANNRENDYRSDDVSDV
jgi:hypothetical protein